MENKNIAIIALCVVILMLSSSAYFLYDRTSKDITTGSHNILILCADPSEKRPGMGGVDLAFVIQVDDMNVTNITTIYPGGMIHESATTPSDLQAIGGGSKYRLHDTLWTNDTEKGSELAQEIVEQKTGMKTDVVIIITPDAVDSVLSAANMSHVSNDSLSFVREKDNETDNDRGKAAKGVVEELVVKMKNPTTLLSMVNSAVDQYNKGNILVYPKEVFTQLVISMGINKAVN